MCFRRFEELTTRVAKAFGRSRHGGRLADVARQVGGALPAKHMEGRQVQRENMAGPDEGDGKRGSVRGKHRGDCWLTPTTGVCRSMK